MAWPQHRHRTLPHAPCSRCSGGRLNAPLNSNLCVMCSGVATQGDVDSGRMGVMLAKVDAESRRPRLPGDLNKVT